jgi:hypothetical protein
VRGTGRIVRTRALKRQWFSAASYECGVGRIAANVAVRACYLAPPDTSAASRKLNREAQDRGHRAFDLVAARAASAARGVLRNEARAAKAALAVALKSGVVTQSVLGNRLGETEGEERKTTLVYSCFAKPVGSRRFIRFSV